VIDIGRRTMETAGNETDTGMLSVKDVDMISDMARISLRVDWRTVKASPHGYWICTTGRMIFPGYWIHLPEYSRI